MNSFEKELAEALKILKEKYYATGVKVEFETETITHDEILMLKNITKDAGLDFIIKTGGSGAVRDLYDAKMFDADTIVAPMVESPYALEKFISAVNSVFTSAEDLNKKLFINIETKQGFNNLDEIFKSRNINSIAGIVVGRSDLSASLGLNMNEVNGEKILEYTKNAASYAERYKKEFIVGGNISAASLSFLKKMPQNSLTKFETRKIVFNSCLLNEKNNPAEGILKAIEFELLWLRGSLMPDNKRLNTLKERCYFKY